MQSPRRVGHQSNAFRLGGIFATEPFGQAFAVTGEGIDQVKRTIKKLAVGYGYEEGDSVLVFRLRHKVLLQQAAEVLRNALTAIDDIQSAECVVLEL
jgi:tRNA U34 5-carboxymethylaminomethyl modifying GTPase MnmE/TrmE